MLQEQKGGFAGAHRKILLDLAALLAAKGRVGQHHIVTVLFLNVGKVFAQGVGVDDVRRLDAVQDHVHDRDDIGERLLFLAVKGAGLQRRQVCGGQGAPCSQVVERLAQKARRAAGAVIDALADMGPGDRDDGADQWARGVVFAAVAPGVAHTLDLLFVERRQLVFFRLRAEAQFIDVVDDLAQIVPAGDLVSDLAENLPDLVFDRVRAARLLGKAVRYGNSCRLTKSQKSSPVIAVLWSSLPFLALGAAQLSQR